MTESPYKIIKRSIADGIATGRWTTGQILPSEHALCRDFRVSRMTVNRAMRELSNENLIRRVAGVGSFVAEPIAQSGLVEIRNIADEIVARGHAHQSHVLVLEAVSATSEVRTAFGFDVGAAVFHSKILHCEDEIPLQVEDRFVNPAIAPDYLKQDFSEVTPSGYLMTIAPLEQVEHRVRAIAADECLAELLDVTIGEACLLVVRRTWSRDVLASLAFLHHNPRFELIGQFNQLNAGGSGGDGFIPPSLPS